MDLFNLDRKVISYFILTRIIAFIIFLAAFIFLIISVPEEYLIAALIPSGIFLLFISFLVFVLPVLEYKAYGYYYDEEKIIIKSGVFFRKYRVIPTIQVQDVGTFQGPIKILYNISTITISTAGSVERIICVDKDIATNIVNEINKNIHKRLIGE